MLYDPDTDSDWSATLNKIQDRSAAGAKAIAKSLKT